MCFDKMKNYFSKHVYFGNAIHVLAGAGIGLLIYPYISGYNTVTLGVVLLVLSALGHLYALVAKEKKGRR